MNDHEEIRRTLAEYCLLVDDGHYDDWADLFTQDAIFAITGYVTVEGRDAVRAHAHETFGKGPVRHLTVNSAIVRADASATVRSDLVVVLPSDTGPRISAVGRYDDELVREADRWRFRSRVITVTREWITPPIP